MADASYLAWPFFDDGHRRLAADVEAWAARELAGSAPPSGDVDAHCRAVVRKLGEAGWIAHPMPAAFGGARERIDVRTLCLIREVLSRHDPLAAFAYAMQGLGTAPMLLFGDEALARAYLPEACAGRRIAAFAISERQAGSDVSAMESTARRDGGSWVLDGEKTWISNAGIADHYVCFCRTPELGERAFGAFVVDASNPGLEVSGRLRMMAAHPIGTIRLHGCRVPAAAMIGEAGKGLRVALGTLDVFRATVGASAVGMARRALDEAVAHVRRRHAFGQPLASFQLTQARLADMATAIDASALLVYRAAWTRDNGAARITREAAMAKLHATESAQQVIDDAVQLLGGLGVVADAPVELLYREIRALRIYEGTSEIQRLVIAGQVLEQA